MAEHAHNVCMFLEDFVRRERIPTAYREANAGGIVLLGWSLGGASVEAFFTHAGEVPIGDVQLSKYVRRVVIYDTSCLMFGYPRPANWYHPSSDPFNPPSARPATFDDFIWHYFTHGDPWTHGALEHRAPASDVVNTKAHMSPSELAACTCPAPAQVGASEFHLTRACVAHGTYGALKDGAVYLLDGKTGESTGNEWTKAEVCVVWCDRSPWEMVWGAYLLDREIREARAAGKSMHDVRLVRMKGANHFVHWDMPEMVMRVFLGTRKSVVE